MTFVLRPAVREKIGLLFGIAGASGSGKTRSALHLANGIAGDTGKIAVLDTEAGRALHYAPKPGEKADSSRGTFDFMHCDFPPPFTPERYVEAIKACEEAGATVVVVDSMSHEWDGEGGCSDIQEVEALRMARGDVSRIEAMTAPAWKAAKKPHKRMMARLIQRRIHLIFCLRAREKIKIVGGKVIPVGFQPDCEKNFMYELSGSFMLHPTNPGCPDYELAHKLNDDLQLIIPDSQLVTDDAGKRLRMWAETGADAPKIDKAAELVRDLIEQIDDTETLVHLNEYLAHDTHAKQRNWLREKRPDQSKRLEAAIEAAEASFAAMAGSGGGDTP